MQVIAFLQNLSSWEIILIFLVVLLFFGAKRLPDLFRSFGKSLKEFKKATSDIEEDIRTAMDEEPEEKKKPAHPPAKTAATTDPKQVEATPDADDDEPDSDAADDKPDSNAEDDKPDSETEDDDSATKTKETYKA